MKSIQVIQMLDIMISNVSSMEQKEILNRARKEIVYSETDKLRQVSHDWLEQFYDEETKTFNIAKAIETYLENIMPGIDPRLAYIYMIELASNYTGYRKK